MSLTKNDKVSDQFTKDPNRFPKLNLHRYKKPCNSFRETVFDIHDIPWLDLEQNDFEVRFCFLNFSFFSFYNILALNNR